MKSNTKKSGVVILYAVLVASVISIGGILLANIIVKQLILSSVGKEARFAYYAANAGDECARFGNAQGAFGYYVDISFGDDPPQYEYFDGDIGSLSCVDLTDPPTIEDYAPGKKISFKVKLNGVAGANVTAWIYPDSGGDEPFVVQSAGYNIDDTNHPRRVETVIFRSSTPGT